MKQPQFEEVQAHLRDGGLRLIDDNHVFAIPSRQLRCSHHACRCYCFECQIADGELSPELNLWNNFDADAKRMLWQDPSFYNMCMGFLLLYTLVALLDVPTVLVWIRHILSNWQAPFEHTWWHAVYTILALTIAAQCYVASGRELKRYR